MDGWRGPASRPCGAAIAVIIGVVAGLGLVIALGFTRRPLISALCSALGCGLLAFCVWTCGDGLGEILSPGYLVISVPLAAIGGGLAGLASAWIMRGGKKPLKPKPNGLQDKVPEAS